jgi:hypothetical protein
MNPVASSDDTRAAKRRRVSFAAPDFSNTISRTRFVEQGANSASRTERADYQFILV